MAAPLALASDAMAITPRLRGDSYRIEWRYGGGRGGKPESATFPTEAMAVTAAALVESRGRRMIRREVYAAILGADEDETPPCPMFRQWRADWLATKRDVSADTLAEYRWLLHSKRVTSRLDALRLVDIDRALIQRLMADATDAGLAAATVRKLHVVLHQVFRDAVGRHIRENPCSKPPGQRTNGLPPVKRFPAIYLSRTEGELILRACGPEIRDLVTVAFGTGLRLGELLALTVGDVDLDAQVPVIHVRWARKKSGKVGDPKSEAGNRPVALTGVLVGVVHPRVAGKRPGALVFPAPGGGMWDPKNLRNRYWKPAILAAARCPVHPPKAEGGQTAPDADPDLLCGDYGGTRSAGGVCRAKVAGGMDRCRWHVGPATDAVSDCDCPGRLHVNPRFHDTRHTAVDWLLDAGWELNDVQIRIGHESVKTTIDMYGNRRRRANPDRLAALDKVLAGAVSGGTA
jgi:integrase